jgi:hypothetical protein
LLFGHKKEIGALRSQLGSIEQGDRELTSRKDALEQHVAMLEAELASWP